MQEAYAGIFRFRFWLYGKWTEVVVDDRLPYWPDGKLVFCSNKQEPDEYWGPLLEKAYAKVYGSYENLEGGQTYDALVDMSAGVPEQFQLADLDDSIRAHFWQILLQAFQKDSMLGCSITPDPYQKEALIANGLVAGHAYTITLVAEVEGNCLIRIRNPWGNEKEWTGAWSDESGEWDQVSEEAKAEVGFAVGHDGEFWMSFDDFMAEWHNVQLCHLSVNSFSAEILETDDDSDLKWKCVTHHSAWETGVSSGGCGQSSQQKFWTNPQFLVHLTDVDENDDEDKCSLLVSLMQKDSRLKRISQGTDESAEEYVQFRLFKIREGTDIDASRETGLKLYADHLDRIGTSGAYINSREVTKRFRVDPGSYLIIPSTYDEDHDCEFMLRVFTEQPVDGMDALPADKDGDELTEEEVYVEPHEDDKKVSWTALLNPKIYKNFKNVAEVLMDEGVQDFFKKNFRKIGLAKYVDDPFAAQVGNFLEEQGAKYVSGEYDSVVSGAKSAFKSFFNR